MNLAPAVRRFAPPRVARPLCLGALAALSTFTPAVAFAAPTSGEAAKPVHVLHLASSARDSYDALRLTKDLEQRFVAATDVRLINSGQSLLELLDSAKCGRAFVKRTLDKNAGLDESAERDLDGPCLTKVASSLGASGAPAERYVWGFLGHETSGQSYVVAHLWQKNGPERRVRIPFTAEQSARVAERVYLKLWHPTESGDVRIVSVAAAEGNLWIDDQDRGPFAAGSELTLRAGEHVFELRQRTKVVARAKTAVAAERSVDVRLEPVLEAPTPTTAPPSSSSEPYTPPSTVEITRKSSVLPWVAFGVGAAALAGSGIFFALRQGKESDLERACVDGCPPSRQDDIDGSTRYGALAVVFAGVGVAAAGVGVWALLSSEPSRTTSLATPRPSSARLGPALRYDVRPMAGGAAASLSGSF